VTVEVEQALVHDKYELYAPEAPGKIEFQAIVELITPAIDIEVVQPFPTVLSGEPVGPAIEVIV
jgi:hypothetical protein